MCAAPDPRWLCLCDLSRLEDAPWILLSDTVFGCRPADIGYAKAHQAGPLARTRVERLAQCKSGAEVAQLDLQIRGPGDLFGARQTGALPLRFTAFIRDFALIEQAGDLAEEWLQHDPELVAEESSGREMPSPECWISASALAR